MKKFLIGCGMVTAVILVLMIGAGVFVARWVQDKLPKAERLERLEAALVDRHGEPEAWVPPLDGVYDPERIARFVDVREALQPLGEEVARRFDELARPDRQEQKGIFGVIGGTRDVVGVVGTGMELLALADSLLIEADLGKGEFAHYNLLTVHGLLGADIDVSIDQLTDPEEREDARQALREMLEEYQRDARHLLRAQIDNALRAMASDATHAPDDPQRSAWHELLTRARERSGGPLPLTDPLPPGFVAAIQPWRAELERSRPTSVGELLRELPFVLRTGGNAGNVSFRF